MSESPAIIVPGKEGLVDFNEIIPDDSIAHDLAAIEAWTSKRIGTELVRLYPGRNWEVCVDMPNGSVMVKCPDVSTTHGYHISLDRSMNDILGSIKNIGGEILERGNISRDKKLTEDQALDQIVERERDLRGTLVNVDNS